MRRRLVVAALAGLLVTGCGGGRDPVATEAPPSTSPGTPSESASVRPQRSASPSAEPVSAADVELARRFLAFATEPSAATHADVPFAAEVEIGLGRDLLTTLDTAAAVHAESWDVEVESFRAYVGTFSALRSLRRQLAEVGSFEDGFQVSVGDHPHCASPPVPAPEGYADLRRVSIQPAEESIDSCLMWFTVDLFVSRGRVAAVTLDLYEP